MDDLEEKIQVTHTITEHSHNHILQKQRKRKSV